jgi:hypothetical protein
MGIMAENHLFGLFRFVNNVSASDSRYGDAKKKEKGNY